MQISTNDTGEVHILSFQGNMDTNSAPEAENEINTLIESGVGKLLFNFEQLEYISSSGLRVLLATAKKMTTIGGEFKICCLNKTVQEVFDISGFSSILSVALSEKEALGNF